MAAGVGKTYGMLGEGRRRAARGLDVVIGLVTTHDRPETEKQLHASNRSSPKIVHYRGARFEEMDLDAVLARRPGLTLVDELAHSNIPGAGRNDKRWQDVVELLNANINVFTTVNVQHIQSLADVVEQITGISVPERVLTTCAPRRPDRTRRLPPSSFAAACWTAGEHSSPTDRVQRALAGFFATENLTALRELTQRFLADETDGDLLQQLHRSRPDLARLTAERVLVGVTAAPGTDAVLRRAARIAARLRADLHVVHVAPTDALRSADHAGLTRCVNWLSSSAPGGP